MTFLGKIFSHALTTDEVHVNYASFSILSRMWRKLNRLPRVMLVTFTLAIPACGGGGGGGGSSAPAPVEPPPVEPPTTGVTSFTFGPGVSDSDEQLIRDTVAASRPYLLDNLGVTISGNTDVFVFTDLDLLVDAYMKFYNLDPNTRPDVRKKWENNTAEANNGGMFINAGHPGWILSGIDDTTERNTLRSKTVGHEDFHLLQAELGVQGATWLLEGTAEYIGWLLAVDRGLTTFSDAYAKNILDARRECALLSSLETREAFNTSGFGYNLGFLALDFMPKPSGLQSLVDFLRATKTSVSWQAAFLSEFGIDVDTFYSQFEAHRSVNFPPVGPC